MQKRSIQVVCGMALLGLVLSCLPVMAQQGGGGRGGFRGEMAKNLADALLLDDQQTEKFIAAYDAASAKAREGMDFQGMSREERQEAMTKINAKVAAQLKTDLKDVLSETELNSLEPLMARRGGFMPIPEVRGLRLVGLKAEQKETLRPLTIALAQAVVPMSFRPQDQQQADPEAQKKFDDAKAALTAKAGEVLTAEQKDAWKTKTEEVQKENEAMRERMQQMRQNRQ